MIIDILLYISSISLQNKKYLYIGFFPQILSLQQQQKSEKKKKNLKRQNMNDLIFGEF